VALNFLTTPVIKKELPVVAVGARFGRLEVLSCQGKNKYYQILWLCRCDCGEIKIIQGGHLRSGLNISCGCYNSEITNLVGQKFSRLEVVSHHHKTGKKVFWICKCECSKEVVVLGGSLTSVNTTSCGCFKKEETTKRFTTHGMTHTSTFKSWSDMKQRCLNPNDRGYKHYGGRGIQVCQRWQESFENFLEDMGVCPDGLTLDRQNNDGNYEKDNCKWATKDEQMNNRRNSVVLEYEGQSKTAAQWAKEKGISPYTIYDRLSSGWSAERAISTPVVSNKEV